MLEKIDFKNAASTSSLIYVIDDKVLLIKRKHEPFLGMWALPGGFLNCDEESLEQAAIREFFEETNLVTCLDQIELFSVSSSPKRDPRGHVIDHVYFVKESFGEIKAKDDAESFCFFDIYCLPDLAFDHAYVLNKFLINFVKGSIKKLIKKNFPLFLL